MGGGVVGLDRAVDTVVLRVRRRLGRRERAERLRAAAGAAALRALPEGEAAGAASSSVWAWDVTLDDASPSWRMEL